MMSIYVTSFKQFNKPPIKFQTRFKLQFANMLFRSGGRPAYNFTRWRRRKNCVDWNEKWCICVVYNRADSDCAENVHAGFLGNSNFCLRTNQLCLLGLLCASAAAFMIDDFAKSKHCTLVLAVSVQAMRIF